MYCVERGGWVPACELRPGERVRTVDGSARLATKTRRPGRQTVYNLEVHDTHRFYVSPLGLLVHNTGIGCRISDALANGDLRIVGKQAAGVTRPDRHHIFPRKYRSWFAERGMDIDRYTLPVEQGVHSAIHTHVGLDGGWNRQLMARLYAEEAKVSRKLTVREIFKIGDQLRRKAGLKHAQIIHYRAP